jgi:hypothetical protein
MAEASNVTSDVARNQRIFKHGLKKIQYQPGLIEGRLAGTGLSLEPDRPTSRIKDRYPQTGFSLTGI